MAQPRRRDRIEDISVQVGQSLALLPHPINEPFRLLGSHEHFLLRGDRPQLGKPPRASLVESSAGKARALGPPESFKCQCLLQSSIVAGAGYHQVFPVGIAGQVNALSQESKPRRIIEPDGNPAARFDGRHIDGKETAQAVEILRLRLYFATARQQYFGRGIVGSMKENGRRRGLVSGAYFDSRSTEQHRGKGSVSLP